MKEIILNGADLNKTVFVLLLMIFIVISYTMLVTFLAALLRGLTSRARQIVKDSPMTTVLMGLIGWIGFAVLAAWLYSLAFFIAAAIAIIVPALICLLGAPGLYSHIGDRIAAMRDRKTSDLGCVVLGSIVALTAAMFPFVGWFLVMPLLLAAEFGAGFRSLVR